MFGREWPNGERHSRRDRVRDMGMLHAIRYIYWMRQAHNKFLEYVDASRVHCSCAPYAHGTRRLIRCIQSRRLHETKFSTPFWHLCRKMNVFICDVLYVHDDGHSLPWTTECIPCMLVFARFDSLGSRTASTVKTGRMVRGVEKSTDKIHEDINTVISHSLTENLDGNPFH